MYVYGRGASYCYLTEYFGINVEKKPQNGMLHFNIIHGPVVKLTENS